MRAGFRKSYFIFVFILALSHHIAVFHRFSWCLRFAFAYVSKFLHIFTKRNVPALEATIDHYCHCFLEKVIETGLVLMGEKTWKKNLDVWCLKKSAATWPSWHAMGTELPLQTFLEGLEILKSRWDDARLIFGYLWMCLHISCGILYFYHLHSINPAKDPRDPKNVKYNI